MRASRRGGNQDVDDELAAVVRTCIHPPRADESKAEARTMIYSSADGQRDALISTVAQPHARHHSPECRRRRRRQLTVQRVGSAVDPRSAAFGWVRSLAGHAGV
jgi:hypothetical protein